MRLKLFACLCIAVAMGLVTRALAAPISTPFLAVDVNGANYGGGQTVGPTQAGYQPWNAFSGFDVFDPNYLASEDWAANGGPPNGLSKTFATGQGNIPANMIGVGQSLSSRNRGGASESDLLVDFAFAQRDNAIAFGRNYIKLVLAGLVPNQAYEFTGHARDSFNGQEGEANTQASYQAWSDLRVLGGLDGPAAWMDANVGAGSSYQPALGGANDPIPNFGRAPTTGAINADPYHYSKTFVTYADATGKATVYTWADPNSFTGVQGAALLDGFEVGIYVPEPASFSLCGLGFVGLILAARRRKN